MNTQLSLRELASKTIAEGEEWLKNARFKATPESRVARLYTLSIFEQFHAALLLLDNGAGTHSPCVIRAMLEYLVDLRNVRTEPEYCSQLVKENAFSDNKIIKSYIDALMGGEHDETIVKEVSELLAEIQARDRNKAQSRFEKIATTGQHELPTLYALLCGMTHPNLSSLLARHKQEDGDGPLRYLCPPHPAVYNMLLSMGLRLLTLTIRELPSFTDCDPDQISKFADTVDATNIQTQKVPDAQ